MRTDYKTTYDFAMRPNGKAELKLPFLGYLGKDKCGIYNIKVLNLNSLVP